MSKNMLDIKEIKKYISDKKITSTNIIKYFFKNYVSSTNDYIKFKYIRDCCPVLILTNHQRRPRGRMGRIWINYSHHSLAFSLCIKINKNLYESNELSRIVAITVKDVFQSLGGSDLIIKWPNDIFCSGKKVCGILIENMIIDKKNFYSIIGIGINLTIPKNYLEKITDKAGNLNIEDNNKNILIAEITGELIKNIKEYENDKELLKILP
tara:strand:- start:1087 stop:1716 length:630 start_codon:yes stop_codon:yes gene_type:complete